MKKIFSAFLAVMMITSMSVTHAQELTAEFLGMPQEVFNASNNVVFNQRTFRLAEIVPTTTRTVRNGVTTTTTGDIIRWNTKNSVLAGSAASKVGIYGIHLIHDYIHSYGLTYSGQNDTSLVFTNSNQEAYLSVNGNKVRFTVITHHEKYTSVRNDPKNPSRKTFIHFTRQQVDSLSKKYFKFDILELEKRCAYVFTGEYKNPQTHLTSFFPWAIVENGKVINKTLINGKPAGQINLSTLINANGRTGFSYMVRWNLLNECEVTATSNLIAGEGNMGQCGNSDWLERFDTRANELQYSFGQTFTYNRITNAVQYNNSKKSYAVLYMGEKPISGKEASSQCYINLLTGEVSLKPFK